MNKWSRLNWEWGRSSKMKITNSPTKSDNSTSRIKHSLRCWEELETKRTNWESKSESGINAPKSMSLQSWDSECSSTTWNNKIEASRAWCPLRDRLLARLWLSMYRVRVDSTQLDRNIIMRFHLIVRLGTIWVRIQPRQKPMRSSSSNLGVHSWMEIDQSENNRRN